MRTQLKEDSVDPLDALIEKTNADLDEIERLRSAMKGPCTECKFRVWISIFEPDQCTCPALTGLYLDPVDGKVEPKLKVYCESARRSRGKCGPEGLCFVPKPPPPPPEPEPPRLTFWQRIFS